jgi:Ca-activated chloride channel family protein
VVSFRLLSVALLVVGGAHSIAAREPQDGPPALAQQPRPTFRSATNMVALNVTVTKGQALVRGLTRDAFVVYEDGVPQQLTFFESSAVPLDLILLLDASSSMRHRMGTVHDAAIGFMDVLRPGDRGAVVAFNERVTVMQDLTSDRQAIADAIDATTAGGSTALYTALYVSLKEFGKRTLAAGEVRRQAIAVLSDGEDTASLLPLEEILALARSTGVTVYTISLQPTAGRNPDGTPVGLSAAHALRQLARETGARAFFPGGVDQLETVYRDIAAELGAQYSIGYLPSNPRIDGRFRRIHVSIPRNPEFRPRTRTGYTASRSPATASGF